MNDGFFFDWPCDRRDAHHPHTVLCAQHTEEECEPMPCPGVPAHPATQIGGSYKRY